MTADEIPELSLLGAVRRMRTRLSMTHDRVSFMPHKVAATQQEQLHVEPYMYL